MGISVRFPKKPSRMEVCVQQVSWDVAFGITMWESQGLRMGFDVNTPEAAACMGNPGSHGRWRDEAEGTRSLSPHKGPVTDGSCVLRR